MIHVYMEESVRLLMESINVTVQGQIIMDQSVKQVQIYQSISTFVSICLSVRLFVCLTVCVYMVSDCYCSNTDHSLPMYKTCISLGISYFRQIIFLNYHRCISYFSTSWEPVGSTKWLGYFASTTKSQSGWSGSLRTTRWSIACCYWSEWTSWLDLNPGCQSVCCSFEDKIASGLLISEWLRFQDGWRISVRGSRELDWRDLLCWCWPMWTRCGTWCLQTGKIV